MNLSQRLTEIRTGFERPFWVANISEIFERLAYYGAFASLANYLHETLDFPTEQTLDLTGSSAAWYGSRYFWRCHSRSLGFRRALSLAYLILTAAYFLIASIGAPWLAPVRAVVPFGFLLDLFSFCRR